MNHDYPSLSPAVPGICAVAAAILLTSGFLPALASAADYRHGTLKGRNIFGCNKLEHYIETAHAFEDVNKKGGKKALDEHLKEGVCKMLEKGKKATVTGSHSEHSGLKVQIEGESQELWISATHFKHD